MRTVVPAALLLLAAGCAADSQPDRPRVSFDDEARTPWVCEDASWSYGDTVVADSCFAEEGASFFESDASITCHSDTAFTWRIGRVEYDCDAYGEDGVFTCLYFESIANRSGIEDDHDYIIVGRFVSATHAVGANKYTYDAPGDTCSIDRDFVATR